MAGRYKAYPEYKRFNSTWFDSLPSHWQSVSMKWITNLYAGGTPSKDNLSFWENGSIPWLNSGSVNQSVIKKPSAFITRDAFNNSSAKWIPKGSLVMALAGQGKTKGMVAQLAIESTCNQSMAAIVPSQIVSPRFLFWWLTSNYQKIRNIAGGDLRDGLNLDLLGNISCPIFECKEQQKIANFLDYETAKIDTLITKQEKLIELLKEKRQAVISHAVTKGLNPDAPMKDSGVEWLGEVPEHWDVTRFKFLCDNIIAGPFGSSITKDMYVKSGFKVYGQEQVIPNNFSIGDYFISADDYLSLARYKVSTGDVLISCVGTFGKVAVFPPSAQAGIINPRLIKAKIHKDNSPYFIREYLKSVTVAKQFDQFSRGGTMGVINIAILNEIVSTKPPYVEQCEIYDFIKAQKSKFSLLLDRCEKQIALLKERKTALISAAVTGKIDVRDRE